MSARPSRDARPAPAPGTDTGEASGFVDRIQSTAQRVVERVAGTSGTRRHAVSIAYWTVLNAHQAQLARMAAALAYRTIFGMIPVLVVGLAVLGAFSTPTQMRDVIHRLLKFSGISDISVAPDQVVGPPAPESWPSNSPSAPEPGKSESLNEKGHEALVPAGGAPDASAQPAGAEATPGGVSEGPLMDAQRADEWIAQLVDRVRSIPFGPIGVVGLVALFYAALSMMVEIERAFNQICRAPTGRSWTRRVMQYWTLLTLGTMLLVASFYVGERVNEIAAQTALFAQDSSLRPLALRALGFGTTVAISSTLLLIVYATIPNTRVKFVPALLGAFIGALLWETGKWGFTQYLRYSASYSRLYGSIALLPLFLMWIYVTWFIVLLGMQLTHTVQTLVLRGRAGALAVLRVNEFGEPDAGSAAPDLRIIDPASTLAVMAAVGDAFRAGVPGDASTISERTGLDARTASDLLERLAEAGLLHRVYAEGQDAAYTLARPPEAIQAAEVLAVGARWIHGSGEPTAGQPYHLLMDMVNSARLAVTEGKTLGHFLLSKPGAPDSIPAPASGAIAPEQDSVSPDHDPEDRAAAALHPQDRYPRESDPHRPGVNGLSPSTGGVGASAAGAAPDLRAGASS